MQGDPVVECWKIITRRSVGSVQSQPNKTKDLLCSNVLHIRSDCVCVFIRCLTFLLVAAINYLRLRLAVAINGTTNMVVIMATGIVRRDCNHAFIIINGLGYKTKIVILLNIVHFFACAYANIHLWNFFSNRE